LGRLAPRCTCVGPRLTWPCCPKTPPPVIVAVVGQLLLELVCQRVAVSIKGQAFRVLAALCGGADKPDKGLGASVIESLEATAVLPPAPSLLDGRSTLVRSVCVTHCVCVCGSVHAWGVCVCTLRGLWGVSGGPVSFGVWV
jgi:hypothetical protein